MEQPECDDCKEYGEKRGKVRLRCFVAEVEWEDTSVACIVVIDDDLSMDVLGDRLRFGGHDVQRFGSASAALEQMDVVVAADLIFLDIIMAWPATLDRGGFAGAPNAGMEVLREIRKRCPDLPVIVYSATQDGAIIEALADDPRVTFLSKWGSPSLRELVQKVDLTLGLRGDGVSLRPFIVHGHDNGAMLELKNYLQNALKLPEPTILREEANAGRTLIEKFEDYAVLSSIVFVLLTPDDLIADAGDANDQKRRARQNVIFEMGYFVGMLGRRSGRVLLLYKGPLEIPSDLAGVVYIDISGGIEAAGEKIRREVKYVRP